MLFQGNHSASTVEVWVKKLLLKDLKKPSIIVMDNVLVHNKKTIKNLLEKHSHTMLPLSPYSPNLSLPFKALGVINGDDFKMARPKRVELLTF